MTDQNEKNWSALMAGLVIKDVFGYHQIVRSWEAGFILFDMGRRDFPDFLAQLIAWAEKTGRVELFHEVDTPLGYLCRLPGDHNKQLCFFDPQNKEEEVGQRKKRKNQTPSVRRSVYRQRLAVLDTVIGDGPFSSGDLLEKCGSLFVGANPTHQVGEFLAEGRRLDHLEEVIGGLHRRVHANDDFFGEDEPESTEDSRSEGQTQSDPREDGLKTVIEDMDKARVGLLPLLDEGVGYDAGEIQQLPGFVGYNRAALGQLLKFLSDRGELEILKKNGHRGKSYCMTKAGRKVQLAMRGQKKAPKVATEPTKSVEEQSVTKTKPATPPPAETGGAATEASATEPIATENKMEPKKPAPKKGGGPLLGFSDDPERALQVATALLRVSSDPQKACTDGVRTMEIAGVLTREFGWPTEATPNAFGRVLWALGRHTSDFEFGEGVLRVTTTGADRYFGEEQIAAQTITPQEEKGSMEKDKELLGAMYVDLTVGKFIDFEEVVRRFGGHFSGRNKRGLVSGFLRRGLDNGFLVKQEGKGGPFYALTGKGFEVETAPLVEPEVTTLHETPEEVVVEPALTTEESGVETVEQEVETPATPVAEESDIKLEPAVQPVEHMTLDDIEMVVQRIEVECEACTAKIVRLKSELEAEEGNLAHLQEALTEAKAAAAAEAKKKKVRALLEQLQAAGLTLADLEAASEE